MKKVKLVLNLFVVFVATSFYAQVEEQVNPKVAPVMTFEKKVHDFGTITEGEKVEFDYNFTNTGKTDLVISKIKGSCGCTVPSNWKKEPIKPGEKSSFHVVFNSRNKPNKQHKSISITCNTVKGRETVSFKGMVTPDPKMQKVREERQVKRREAAAKRKAERTKLATQEATSGPKEESIKEVAALAEKERKVKRQELEIIKQRAENDKVIIKDRKKSEKQLKRSEKDKKEQLSIAKKDQKLKAKQLKADQKRLKSEEKAAKRELDAQKDAIKREEKERKRNEKELARKLKAEKKARKAAEKEAKAAEKEIKRVAKAAKKKEKLQAKVNKVIDKVEKEENKLAKLESKFKRKNLKGKLSPNDILDYKEDILKQQEKINDAKTKLAKAKRKLQ